MITAAFNVGKADVLALTLDCYSSSPTVQRSKTLTWVSVPVAMGLIAALFYFQNPGYGALAIPLLMFAAVWALVYPRLHARCLVQMAKKMLNESSYQGAFGAYTVTLGDDGIVSSSPIGEGRYPWSSVSRVSLTPEHLFIFLAGVQGYPIPRDQVPEALIQEMKVYVEQNMQRAEPTAPPKAGCAGIPAPSVS